MRIGNEPHDQNSGEVSGKTVYRSVLETVVSALLALSSVILIFTTIILIPMLYKVNPFSIFSLKAQTDWYLLIGLIFSVLLLIFSILYMEKNVRILSTSLSNLKHADNIASLTGPIPNEDLLKFLDDGEKRVYGTLVDAGGSFLQRDLFGMDGMSRATVSRIVDRLERKGVVEKIRHGSTNMIVLKRISR